MCISGSLSSSTISLSSSVSAPEMTRRTSLSASRPSLRTTRGELVEHLPERDHAHLEDALLQQPEPSVHDPQLSLELAQLLVPSLAALHPVDGRVEVGVDQRELADEVHQVVEAPKVDADGLAEALEADLAPAPPVRRGLAAPASTRRAARWHRRLRGARGRGAPACAGVAAAIGLGMPAAGKSTRAERATEPERRRRRGTRRRRRPRPAGPGSARRGGRGLGLGRRPGRGLRGDHDLLAGPERLDRHARLRRSRRRSTARRRLGADQDVELDRDRRSIRRRSAGR